MTRGVYVVFPAGVHKSEFSIWLCDGIEPGTYVAQAPTREGANGIALLLAAQRGARTLLCDELTAQRGANGIALDHLDEQDLP